VEFIGACSRACPAVRSPLRGLAVYTVFQWPLQPAIHAFKYQGRFRLAAPLGNLLALTYCAWQLRADLLVPVPLAPGRLVERGYNQSALLAERCAARVRVPVGADLLVRWRETRQQVGLAATERRRNVAGAFVATPLGGRYLPGRHVVLIDDVCTSGATMEAAAMALLAGGAASVWGLALARPVRGPASVSWP
jgi:ComF family protein